MILTLPSCSPPRIQLSYRLKEARFSLDCERKGGFKGETKKAKEKRVSLAEEAFKKKAAEIISKGKTIPRETNKMHWREWKSFV
jgi:hypothetical protein